MTIKRIILNDQTTSVIGSESGTGRVAVTRWAGPGQGRGAASAPSGGSSHTCSAEMPGCRRKRACPGFTSETREICKTGTSTTHEKLLTLTVSRTDSFGFCPCAGSTKTMGSYKQRAVFSTGPPPPTAGFQKTAKPKESPRPHAAETVSLNHQRGGRWGKNQTVLEIWRAPMGPPFTPPLTRAAKMGMT